MTLTKPDVTSSLTGKWKSYPAYKDSGVEWLGEIPEHWKVRRLKYIARLSYGDSLPADTRAEGETTVFGSNGPVGVHSEPNTLAPALVIGRKGSFGKINFSDHPCFAIDTTYFIDSRNSKENLRWLFYALSLLKLDSISEDSAIPGLSRELTEKQWLPIMSLSEQRTIATFLDCETAKINTLIAKKERLVELLQEKRAALISQAVTKGLDPRVAMKDSGVEWLGEIPAHWEVKKIKRLCLVKRGASPRPIDDPIYFDDDGEYAWVRISDVTASVKYLLKTEQTLSSLGQSKSVCLEPGDLFLSIAGTVGKPIITQIKCCIHDGFVYFVGLKQNQEYLFFVFSSGELYKGLGKLGTQLNLNTDTIGDIRIPIPPISEQCAIAAFIDRETAKIDALISRIREGIEKLKEYSTALISAAVTGKIDVRGTIIDD